MADQERMPFCALSQDSKGQLGVQGQYPLPLGCMFSGMVQMDNPDPRFAMTQWSIKKSFDDCHLQFSNQQGQVYMLNWMHAITPSLTLGTSLTHIVSKLYLLS